MYLLLRADQRPKQNHEGRTSACSSTRTVPIGERTWTDIEPGTQSNLAYPVAKRQTTLLRHGQLLREEDGAIEIWRIKDNLQNPFVYSRHWSDEKWKSKKSRRRRMKNTVAVEQEQGRRGRAI